MKAATGSLHLLADIWQEHLHEGDRIEGLQGVPLLFVEGSSFLFLGLGLCWLGDGTPSYVMVRFLATYSTTSVKPRGEGGRSHNLQICHSSLAKKGYKACDKCSDDRSCQVLESPDRLLQPNSGHLMTSRIEMDTLEDCFNDSITLSWARGWHFQWGVGNLFPQRIFWGTTWGNLNGAADFKDFSPRTAANIHKGTTL